MKKLLATVTAGLLAVCAVVCLAGCGEDSVQEKPRQGNSIYNKQIKDVRFFRDKETFTGIKIIHSNEGLQTFLEAYPSYAEGLSDYTIAEGESIVAVSSWRSTTSEEDFTVRKVDALPLPYEGTSTGYRVRPANFASGCDLQITIEYKFSGCGTCALSTIALFAKTEALDEYQDCFVIYRNLLDDEYYEKFLRDASCGYVVQVEHLS